MAFLKQRAGRWSMRGHKIKARQVNGIDMRFHISQCECTGLRAHISSLFMLKTTKSC